MHPVWSVNEHQTVGLLINEIELFLKEKNDRSKGDADEKPSEETIRRCKFDQVEGVAFWDLIFLLRELLMWQEKNVFP